MGQILAEVWEVESKSTDTYKTANLRGLSVSTGKRKKQIMKQTTAPRLQAPKMSIRSHRLTMFKWVSLHSGTTTMFLSDVDPVDKHGVGDSGILLGAGTAPLSPASHSGHPKREDRSIGGHKAMKDVYGKQRAGGINDSTKGISRLTRKKALFLLPARGCWQRCTRAFIMRGKLDISALAEWVQGLQTREEWRLSRAVVGAHWEIWVSARPTQRVDRVAERVVRHSCPRTGVYDKLLARTLIDGSLIGRGRNDRQQAKRQAMWHRLNLPTS